MHEDVLVARQIRTLFADYAESVFQAEMGCVVIPIEFVGETTQIPLRESK